MKEGQIQITKWRKTRHANLLRNLQSRTYYLRAKVDGKLVWRALETKIESVAVLRLADKLKELRGPANLKAEAGNGKMTLAAAQAIYLERLDGDASLKPRTREYRRERIVALLKSWSNLERMDVRKITKADCLEWAARFSKKSSPTAYNNTAGTLKQILDIAVELGACYQNPATHIKRAPVRAKALRLPEPEQFEAFVAAVEVAGVCS